jgi:hypothetical protein
MSSDSGVMDVLSKKFDDQKKKIEDFTDLLKTLSTLEDKKKILWTQIYEHAIEDRTHAYMLFTSLYVNCQGDLTNHQVSGPILAKYIERMSRSNDQIIKLAELIQAASAADETDDLSEDEIYRRIKK